MKKPLPSNSGFIDSYWYPTIIDPLVNIAYILFLLPSGIIQHDKKYLNTYKKYK